MAGAQSVFIPLRHGKGAETLQIPFNPDRMYLLVVNSLSYPIHVAWDMPNNRTEGKMIEARDFWLAQIHQQPVLTISTNNKPFQPSQPYESYQILVTQDPGGNVVIQRQARGGNGPISPSHQAEQETLDCGLM